MPGDVPHAGIGTVTYVRSEYAFHDAQRRGRVDRWKARLTGREPCLLSLGRVAGELRASRAVYRGLRDVPLSEIVGSAGRAREFSRHFHPLATTPRQKERWRSSYTRAMTGRGYPPVEVCRVGGAYFVINGHHRVSVARYLNWETIQAHVSELPVPERGECVAS